ncbi:uncharacterized protein BKA55DRAFT_561860 [Fusarium redolens]|uniref:Uncharacterized protein n=1 Tax=Fusarium redolens TaxID=48865 RepID=A0A9P9HKV6_FUSRE|nr:uncharacterized protein BKA55DRAFT_561860 [Fusarium redolens]KAH7258962.1 hypothetical protein BKA55DRAFT_561860 [Fusarium redolens]
MKPEIIVAIVSLVVSLPPALYTLHTWYQRRSQAMYHPFHQIHLSRRHLELLCSMSERGITLVLRVEEGRPVPQRDSIFRASNPDMTSSC